MIKSISIRGARTNNLKNIDVDIPRHKFVVITGLSGSGKSSLAFDTIYAEGQRRYMESLSSYAKQYVDLMDKPDVDSITGLTPTIAINQKTNTNNPRSTVGTATEIYDLLRLIFSRIGTPHCPETGKPMTKQTIEDIVKTVSKNKQTITILSPLFRKQIITDKKILQRLSKAGFTHIRLDGAVLNLSEQELKIDDEPHTLEIIIAHNNFSSSKPGADKPAPDKFELQKNIKKGIDLSNGLITVLNGHDEQTYSTVWTCAESGYSLEDLEPKFFSFNSPQGACPACKGLGINLHIDPESLFNDKLSINEGAVRPWPRNNGQYNKYLQELNEAAKQNKFSIDTPLKNLTKKQIDVILYGQNNFAGVISILEKRWQETDSLAIKQDIEQYMRSDICLKCGGRRLRPEFLAVKIADLNITDISGLTVESAISRVQTCFKKLSNGEKKVAEPIIKEITLRLQALEQTGLGYVTIDRAMNTLSGGEAQRVKLATQLSSNLINVTYVLDEPSIGLHPKDIQKLLATLKNLRDLENTVIVVEHDKATMLAADYIIDIGPGAGDYGGLIVSAGTPEEIKQDLKSLTGQYLTDKKTIAAPAKYRAGSGKKLTIVGAAQNNLKNITVEFPLGKFIALTGVSGSGKSTLMTDILSKALNKKYYRAKVDPGKHKKIEGLEYIDNVITIQQSPIGRTPRSNP
ncbi:MAG: excinuclease ABC subunit UvrA, partial [Patescibacteria group bacterium]